MSPLTPQAAAALMQRMCQTVPTWEYGALGSHNALRLIIPALQQAHSAEQGARLAFFAWQEDPLDARLARLAAGLQPNATTLALAKWCALPEDAADIATRLRESDGDTLLTLLRRHMPDPDHGGFWLNEGLRYCFASARRADIFLALLEELRRQALECAPQLARRLLAAWSLAQHSTEEALTACGAAMQDFALWQALRQAQCLHKLGQRKEALTLLRKVWQACPSHPNLVLTLDHLSFPVSPAPCAPPPIALYSWNKAEVLAATLESLRNTEGVQVPVYVLDNGSTDNTAALLTQMRDQWPTHEGQGSGLRVLSLPVNVGAPAARNWLLSLPEMRAREELIFLDDDLLLTPGWLDQLSIVAASRPDAAVLGCRITDHTPPHATQCADFFLLPAEAGQRSFLDLEENIFLHCGSMGSTESLLTAHTRPCLSVSGCCHWLRFDAAHGGPLNFDIRLSPSQFDDLERDLRVNLAGHTVVCAGDISIAHVQHSSLRQARNRPRSAHIFGNKIKLEHLYTQAQVKKIHDHSAGLARRDLLRKITRIAAGEGA